MNKVIRRFLIVFLWFSYASTLVGCYSGHKITKKPADAEHVMVLGAPEEKYPVHVSSVTVKDQNLASGFEGRLISRLNKTGLYKDVTYGMYSRRPDTTYIDANLSIDENIDGHTAGNAFKGFFVGLTIFALAPALPLTADFTSTYDLAVIWPNGTRKDYIASCAADAYGTLFQAQTEFKTAAGEVADKCLNSVVNQMSADYHRIAGLSASPLSPTSPPTLKETGNNSTSSILEGAKSKCKQLGFKEHTSDFGPCVMQLISP